MKFDGASLTAWHLCGFFCKSKVYSLRWNSIIAFWHQTAQNPRAVANCNMLLVEGGRLYWPALLRHFELTLKEKKKELSLWWRAIQEDPLYQKCKRSFYFKGLIKQEVLEATVVCLERSRLKHPISFLEILIPIKSQGYWTGKRNMQNSGLWVCSPLISLK